MSVVFVILAALVVGVVLAAFIALEALSVMLVWNWTLPDIFASVPEISFMNAVGVVLLAFLLRGGSANVARTLDKNSET